MKLKLEHNGRTISAELETEWPWDDPKMVEEVKNRETYLCVSPELQQFAITKMMIFKELEVKGIVNILINCLYELQNRNCGFNADHCLTTEAIIDILKAREEDVPKTTNCDCETKNKVHFSCCSSVLKPLIDKYPHIKDGFNEDVWKIIKTGTYDVLYEGDQESAINYLKQCSQAIIVKTDSESFFKEQFRPKKNILVYLYF